MKALTDNAAYWKEVSADSIIGRNAFPGDELLSRVSPDASVLDVGCGTGEMLAFFLQKGFVVTGVDINEEAIKQNKRKQSGTYLVADLRDPFSFDDGSFDVVVISFVLVNIMPLDVRKKLVGELYRVLRKGRTVWVNEGLVSEAYTFRYELCKSFAHEEHDFFVFREGTSSSSIKTRDELEQALSEQKVARVAHHFTEEELHTLFEKFSIVSEEVKATESPNTKSMIKMIVSVYRK